MLPTIAVLCGFNRQLSKWPAFLASVHLDFNALGQYCLDTAGRRRNSSSRFIREVGKLPLQLLSGQLSAIMHGAHAEALAKKLAFIPFSWTSSSSSSNVYYTLMFHFRHRRSCCHYGCCHGGCHSGCCHAAVSTINAYKNLEHYHRWTFRYINLLKRRVLTIFAK